MATTWNVRYKTGLIQGPGFSESDMKEHGSGLGGFLVGGKPQNPYLTLPYPTLPYPTLPFPTLRTQPYPGLPMGQGPYERVLG